MDTNPIAELRSIGKNYHPTEVPPGSSTLDTALSLLRPFEHEMGTAMLFHEAAALAALHGPCDVEEAKAMAQRIADRYAAVSESQERHILEDFAKGLGANEIQGVPIPGLPLVVEALAPEVEESMREEFFLRFHLFITEAMFEAGRREGIFDQQEGLSQEEFDEGQDVQVLMDQRLDMAMLLETPPFVPEWLTDEHLPRMPRAFDLYYPHRATPLLVDTQTGNVEAPEASEPPTFGALFTEWAASKSADAPAWMLLTGPFSIGVRAAMMRQASLMAMAAFGGGESIATPFYEELAITTETPVDEQLDMLGELGSLVEGDIFLCLAIFEEDRRLDGKDLLAISIWAETLHAALGDRKLMILANISHDLFPAGTAHRVNLVLPDATFACLLPFDDERNAAVGGLLASSGEKLSMNDLSGGNLQEALFRNQNLSQASFDEARLSLGQFLGCDATGASFREADLRYCCFVESKIKGGHFEGADLSYSTSEQCALDGAQLQGAKMIASGFSETSFVGANLSKATAPNSRLESADFTGANLSEGIFTDTDFSAAVFNNTNLKGANFIGASLKKATFTDVEAEGAIFSGAKNLTKKAKEALKKAGASFE